MKLKLRKQLKHRVALTILGVIWLASLFGMAYYAYHVGHADGVQAIVDFVVQNYRLIPKGGTSI